MGGEDDMYEERKREEHQGSEASSENGINEAGALLFAVSRGKLRGLKKLLDAPGTSVDSQDYDGRCALHLAAASGKREFIQVLVDHGAKLNLTDRWGRTPLDDALAQDHSDAMQYLESLGAVHGSGVGGPFRPQTLDPKSSIAILLQYAADGDVARVKSLLDSKDVDVDACDYDKRTSLHLAASEGRLEVIKLLCSRGANVNLMDRWGNRCLNDAIRSAHPDCVAYLKQRGAEENKVEEEKLVTLRDASPEAMASLHARGVREMWALDHDDFEMESTPFAKGAGGEIFMAHWRELSCVAKTCGKLTTSAQNLTDLGNEIALMATIRHPNVVMFFGACFQLSPPVLLLEYCSRGNLETRIIRAYSQANDVKSHERISAYQRWKYASDLALGMNFLHKCKIPIIHRDLKPSNVLISNEDTVKLTDFGLAKFVPTKNKSLNDTFTLTGETGSYRFMAPEVYRHEVYNQTVDVYSYSLIIYWLFSGVRPFANFTDPIKAVQFAALERGRPPSSVLKDPRVRAIVEQSWSEQPENRPSFCQICKFWEEIKDPKTGANKEGCSAM